MAIGNGQLAMGNGQIDIVSVIHKNWILNIEY
jgi:hypothetical protein